MYNEEDFRVDLESYKNSYKEKSVPKFINEKLFFKHYEKRRRKKKLYKKFLLKVFNKYKVVYFVTLTFDDLYLPNNEEECYILIRKWLRTLRRKGIDFEYRFNVDLGADNGRFHFHGVTTLDITSYWSYGFTNCKIINFSDNSLDKVSNYCTKIVNHAFKLHCKIISSRSN